MDTDRPRRTLTDPDGPWKTQMDPDGPQKAKMDPDGLLNLNLGNFEVYSLADWIGCSPD